MVTTILAGSVVSAWPGVLASHAMPVSGYGGPKQTKRADLDELRNTSPADGLVSANSLAAPKNACAAFKKGQEALKNSKPDDAHKDFEIAAQIYPGYATAWYELGRLATNRGDLDDALRSF